MLKSLNLKIISLLFLAALTFGVLIPTTTRACACGMLVPENNQEIGMTGERGVVVFDGLKNNEQMAIDFQLDGTSASTALVVPTPVKADISQIKKQVVDDVASLVKPPSPSETPGSIGAAAAKSDNSVQVLERKTVGNFEIAVLKTNSYKDLFDWTKSNGFYLEAEAENPVRTYIDKGFILNVIKLKKDADISDINPLKFTFNTKTIFYPLMEIKDSRDSQKDKSLELYLLTDGAITDPSIISGFNAEVVNKEISTDDLNQRISKTSESDFSNLNFTAGKYFATYITTYDYSADATLTQGLGNPGAKEYTPLGLDYSHSLSYYIPNWVYPAVVTVVIVIATLLAFFLTSRRKPSLAQLEPKNANQAYVPTTPEITKNPETEEKTEIT
jgi:hypothetical protein